MKPKKLITHLATGTKSINLQTGKNLDLGDMEAIFDEMRTMAKPADCSVCLRKNVPCVTMTKADNDKMTRDVCIDCATGKTPMSQTEQQKN